MASVDEGDPLEDPDEVGPQRGIVARGPKGLAPGSPELLGQVVDGAPEDGGIEREARGRSEEGETREEAGGIGRVRGHGPNMGETGARVNRGGLACSPVP